mmetsp:Transcript_10157/g.19124  ORF Transcript_10157/g.19124 Transcript_10157/m.19124 type:complete len:319 (+) Transcript_10157:247-1203(+)
MKEEEKKKKEMMTVSSVSKDDLQALEESGSPRSPLYEFASDSESTSTSAASSPDSPRSPVYLNDRHSLGGKCEEDVMWLKSESRKALAALEYSFHGTVDLSMDVPEMESEPDCTCERFLKGSQWNRSKSMKNITSYIAWRCSSPVVMEEHITESLNAKKVFMLSARDRRGGPVAVIIAKNHDRFKTGAEETIKVLTYTLDKLISSMVGASDGTMIMDLDGIGWRSLDVEALKHIMLFFQNYFPERVSTAVFWRAPKVFFILWRVVKPFLSKATQSKVLFASSTKDLEKKVKLEHLPKRFGGKADDSSIMVPIEESPDT